MDCYASRRRRRRRPHHRRAISSIRRDARSTLPMTRYGTATSPDRAFAGATELPRQAALRQHPRARADAHHITVPLHVADRHQRQRRAVFTLDPNGAPNRAPLHAAIRLAQPALADRRARRDARAAVGWRRRTISVNDIFSLPPFSARRSASSDARCAAAQHAQCGTISTFPNGARRRTMSSTTSRARGAPSDR